MEKKRQEEIARIEDEQRAREQKLAKQKAKKACMIAAPIVVLLIAVILLVNNMMLSNKYNDAVALMNAGNLDEAYNLFVELGDYEDAVDKAGNIRLTKVKEQLKNAQMVWGEPGEV